MPITPEFRTTESATMPAPAPASAPEPALAPALTLTPEEIDEAQRQKERAAAKRWLLPDAQQAVLRAAPSAATAVEYAARVLELDVDQLRMKARKHCRAKRFLREPLTGWESGMLPWNDVSSETRDTSSYS